MKSILLYLNNFGKCLCNQPQGGVDEINPTYRATL